MLLLVAIGSNLHFAARTVESNTGQEQEYSSDMSSPLRKFVIKYDKYQDMNLSCNKLCPPGLPLEIRTYDVSPVQLIRQKGIRKLDSGG